MVPRPASNETTKQMVKHDFSVSKNRDYHQVDQAGISQFRFESASRLACWIGSYFRQFPVIPGREHTG